MWKDFNKENLHKGKNMNKFASFIHNLFHDKTKILESMSMYPYPKEEELVDNQLDDSNVRVSQLNDEDIKDNFTNINDLTWLKPVAENNKVVMLGESHYFRKSYHLRNRIFFALNTFDYYPLIVLEDQYSKTPFIQHFLKLYDDSEAHKYLEQNLNVFITTEEDAVFFEHMRRWNKNNPDKQVTAACSDIEFNYKTTFDYIIEPYFKQMADIPPEFLDSLSESRFTPEFLHTLRNLLSKAKKEQIIGPFPFITYDYIENVIANVESLYYSSMLDKEYYRQKAIVRNLTDTRFLGKYTSENKFMTHGGANHCQSCIEFPEGGSFLSEGSFLNHNFEPTKDKTHSIVATGLGYSLDTMKSINLNECTPQGSTYMKMVMELQKAFADKLIDSTSYYVFNRISDFDKMLIKKAYQYKSNPILINSFIWDKLLQSAVSTQSWNIYNHILQRKNFYDRYNNFISVQQSPILQARKLNSNR
jgi:hypothetical protein